MSRGRPPKYTDSDLKKILVKIVSQNPGKKLTPSYLENSTGIKRHVWSRRMQETIDKLNQPIQIISRDESQLPLPNVVQLVECKCQPKHVHFRLFKDVQNHSFSLVK